MRLATIKQSREIDEMAQKAYGLSDEVLMESAGALASREIDQSFFPELKRGMTSLICGPGNNGGDALVCARHMHSAGHRDLTVFLLSPSTGRSPLYMNQLDRAEKQGINIVDLLEVPEKLELIRSSALIIDGLLGIGLSRPLDDEYSAVVDMMNSTRVPIVSLDCPSGLNCDTGGVLGVAVKATMTLSFGLAKPGFFVGDGPAQVGKLRVIPIGFPYESLRGVATTHFLFNEKLARRYLPQRKDLSNKSDYGHLLVIAGHAGMWGAGHLAAHSAYRIGAGYVTWASQENPPVGDTPEVLAAHIQDPALWENPKISAVAIGPGLGVGQETADLIERLRTRESVVLDADALTSAVQFNLFPFPPGWVLTPHAAELSRIIGWELSKIEAHRFAAALKGAEVTGCHVLLKGFRSVLAYQERCMVINAGNSALAKAGTGDVLTGMIGGLLAQGVDVVQAVATAAYIHGRMSDEWVRIGNDKRSLLASDLKDHLPQLISRISGGALEL